MRRLRPIRRLIDDLRDSFARFEHRGVVVSYRGLLVDQPAIVAGIDAAAAAVTKEGGHPEDALARIRVRVNRDPMVGDGPERVALLSWGGFFGRRRVDVGAGPHCAKDVQEGVYGVLIRDLRVVPRDEGGRVY